MTEDLIGWLNASDPQIRRQAIFGLGEQGRIEAVEPLINFMTTTGDYKEKSLAIAALSEIGIRLLQPMSATLKEAIEDTNSDGRKKTIRVLTQLYETIMSIIRVLEAVIADDSEHPEVRQTADWSLKLLTRARRR